MDVRTRGDRASLQQAGSTLKAGSRERKALAAVAVAVAEVSCMAVTWKRCHETTRGSSSWKDARPSLPLLLWAQGAVGSFGGEKVHEKDHERGGDTVASFLYGPRAKIPKIVTGGGFCWVSCPVELGGRGARGRASEPVPPLRLGCPR
ncbi:hypothetical protein NDU88_007444 [Pleurodeles waltl]|uniref:Uncharacterized protein n=1 Tax=Pleurodeles waltl TaxID=8319 RepID=A0AAV7N5X7_PLEWA|nr:hypothetical protein NDU88_007444 [Pleurodeles waltl]